MRAAERPLRRPTEIAMAHLRGGNVGGLLGSAPPPPPPTAQEWVEVPEHVTDGDGVVRYSLKFGSDSAVSCVRWSQMESLIRDLRAELPEIPQALNLPRYYFKSSDPAKLEQRRSEVQDFWAGLTEWLGPRGISLRRLPPVARLLDSARIAGGADGYGSSSPPPRPADGGGGGGGGGARPPPPVGAAVPPPGPPSPPPMSSSAGARSVQRGESVGSPCLYASQRGESVSKDDFEVITALGEGAYGRVMLVKKRRGGGHQLFALKAIQKRAIAGDESARQRALDEKRIMERFVHTGVPFVVQLHYAFQSAAHIYFVLDFMQGGELFFHLRKHGVFPIVWVRFYAAQILLALRAIHGLDIIYRDLKPENVLLDHTGYIALADFGLSKTKVSGALRGTGTLCGTAAYMAPELIGTDDYGNAVDYWAFGALIYEMVSGQSPFFSENRGELSMRICSPAPVPLPRDTFREEDVVELLSPRGGLLDKAAETRLDASVSLCFHSTCPSPCDGHGLCLSRALTRARVPRALLSLLNSPAVRRLCVVAGRPARSLLRGTELGQADAACLPPTRQATDRARPGPAELRPRVYLRAGGGLAQGAGVCGWWLQRKRGRRGLAGGLHFSWFGRPRRQRLRLHHLCVARGISRPCRRRRRRRRAARPPSPVWAADDRAATASPASDRPSTATPQLARRVSHLILYVCMYVCTNCGPALSLYVCTVTLSTHTRSSVQLLAAAGQQISKHP